MWKTVLVINLLYIISIANDVDAQGRVAPGVPPQHYQQPNQQQFQQQQYQQVPVQQQQHVPVQQQQHMPVQQQHVPVQQQQMHQQQVHHQVPQHQVPNPQHQQVPQHAPHGHHGVPQPGQILNAANIVQEKEHIAEHLEVPIDTSKMTDQELQFHYFKMHDADNNNKLDGCELIKSLIHWHDPAGKVTKTVLSDDSLIELVEPLFQTIDENDDGYVDYMEYKKHT